MNILYLMMLYNFIFSQMNQFIYSLLEVLVHVKLYINAFNSTLMELQIIQVFLYHLIVKIYHH
jgi:hypothetical protein